MNQLAASLAGVGFTASRDKCDVALKAYNDTFAMIKPIAISAISAATGRLIGIKIKVSENFITRAMGKFITSLGVPSEEEDEDAPPPASVPKAKRVRAEAPTGGRTRRRGSKKGRKSRKSRR